MDLDTCFWYDLLFWLFMKRTFHAGRTMRSLFHSKKIPLRKQQTLSLVHLRKTWSEKNRAVRKLLAQLFFRLLISTGCCLNGEECLHSQKVGHFVSEYVHFITNSKWQRQNDSSKSNICKITTRSNFQLDITFPGYYLSNTYRDDCLIR